MIAVIGAFSEIPKRFCLEGRRPETLSEAEGEGSLYGQNEPADMPNLIWLLYGSLATLEISEKDSLPDDPITCDDGDGGDPLTGLCANV